MPPPRGAWVIKAIQNIAGLKYFAIHTEFTDTSKFLSLVTVVAECLDSFERRHQLVTLYALRSLFRPSLAPH